MSEFLSQPAKKTDDMEIKKLTEKVDIWIHDMEADGVVIDIDNRDDIIMHVRFNFAESENLVLQVAEGITQVDEHRCGFDVPPKTLKRVIHLDVENIDLGSYDLKYKVEGFVRNDKGELVDATKHKGSAADLVAGNKDGGSGAGGANNKSSAPATAPTNTATTTALKPGGGEAAGEFLKSGKGGNTPASTTASAPSTTTSTPSAPSSTAGAATNNKSNDGGAAAVDPEAPSPFDEVEGEPEVEEKKVNEHITLVLYHFEGIGYEFRVRVKAGCPATIVSLDCSQSDNLSCTPIQPSVSTGEGKLNVRVVGGAEEDETSVCRLTMKDENEEGYGMAYKVSTKIDSSSQGGSGGSSGSTAGEIDIAGKKKKEAEEAEAKKKAEQAAGEIDIAAKKKKAEEEAEAKKKADQAAGEIDIAAKKKKAEEEAAAKKKADDEDAEKRAADARLAGEMLRKKREEDEKKKAEENAAKKKHDEENRKKDAEEKDKQRSAMLEKAKKEAEDQAKREADKKAAKEAFEKERARVAAEHKAKEEELYGEMMKKKLTPFEEREVAEADAAAQKEGEDFARDCIAKNGAAAPLKDEYVKTWKLYAFIKRRYEIEWRLRFLLIEKMFWERVCSLCRDFMPQGSEIKQYKQHKVHPECYDKAPKCDMCGEILIGNYVMTKGDNPTRLHNECVAAYKNKSRPDCKKCGKKILEDKWTTKGTDHYHTACG